MRTQAPAPFRLSVAGAEIECAWAGEAAWSNSAPIVLLHHGFGSVSDWRGFPAALAAHSRRPCLTYSRRGCGSSTPRFRRHDLGYLADEALVYLPALLDAAGIARCHIVGHSDGATIALHFASAFPDRCISCTALAPHVFAERITVDGVRDIRHRYLRDKEFETRIARFHDNPDEAFLGWAEVWIDPAFQAWSIVDELRCLSVPTMIIQGTDDPFGTLAHAQLIERHAKSPPTLVVLPGGHNPHIEHGDTVLAAISESLIA